MTRNVIFGNGGLFTSEGNWIHPRRSIETTELIIVKKGTVCLEEDGQEYELRPGDFIFLAPGKIHGGCRMSAEQVSFYWFHFWDKVSEQEGGCTEGTFVKTGTVSEKDRINLLCRQLLHYSNTPGYPKEASDYSMRLLLIELMSLCHTQAKGSIRFSEICEWIRMHGELPLTSALVAAQFGYHEDYLARLFRRNLNCSLKQYLIQARLSYLKSQLLSTDLTLKELAAQAGFAEYKHFLKFFTGHEGITPTAYRNMYYNTHENKH